MHVQCAPRRPIPGTTCGFRVKQLGVTVRTPFRGNIDRFGYELNALSATES